MSRRLGLGYSPLQNELFYARQRFIDAGKGLSHDEQSEILSIAEKNCSIEALGSKTVQEKFRELDSYHGREQGTAGKYAGLYVICLDIQDKVKQVKEIKQLTEKMGPSFAERHYDQLEANKKAEKITILAAGLFVFGFIFWTLFAAWQKGLL